ncbi:MAG: SDR family NAD(P)-dependent oxidoreductase [Bacillota bacterium]|jgi:NAD(P)-dependent dehydrogenase (short-subunit alcohol dehydrogenase family)
MDLQLRNKKILVTGSTSGIGKAIAAVLLEEGATVFINARTQESVQRVFNELTSIGHVIPAAGDLSTPEGAEKVMKAVDAEGDLDVLVNNAGTYNSIPFESMTDEDWMKMIETNFMSVVRTCRHYLPIMLARNAGRILNISSEVAYKPIPTFLHYCATKGAVSNLTRGLAELTKGTKVTVNAIVPGPTWTEGTAEYQTGIARKNGMTIEAHIEDYFNRFDPTSLVKRFVDPREIATTVAYYCSDLSSATNGAPIRVEGGIIRFI